MSDLIDIYGIKNCDTVKKALTWLNQQAIEYEFHDFKKETLTQTQVKQWLTQIGAQTLINRRGTTWRKLSDAQKALTAARDLIPLIIDNPSLVKRPVLSINGELSVGFDADDWQTKLSQD